MSAAGFDDNHSSWIDELPPYTPWSALPRDVSADVVVVGGGLTGISTAWHLSTAFPSRRVVVLEAKSLANGASGRNGGQVLNGINGIEPKDPDTARLLHAATRTGIDIVEDLASHSELDTGFVRHGCLEVSTTAESAEAAEQRVRRANEWGIPLYWLGPDETGVHGAHGAVLDPTAARVNSAALVRGLRGRLRNRGVEIYEQTPVLRIREGETVVVETPRAVVRAGAVVLATNAYTPRLGYFRGGILPLHSLVVATAPLSERCWSDMGWYGQAGFVDDLDRIAYGCRTPGGRLLFGGGGNAAYHYRFGGSPVRQGGSGRAFRVIENRMRGYFPGVESAGLDGELVSHRWSGPLALTFDRVCSMGVRGSHRNVYYSLGYSGHGLALAALAGRVLSDLYGGNHDSWRELPFYQRRLPLIPPEPFRWLGYQAYTLASGRSPRQR